MKEYHDNYISLDTEYDARTRVPFIMTTCDTALKTKLYDLTNKIDYKHAKKVAESRSISKVLHNSPADICALSTIGIHIPIDPHLLEDTMIIAGLVQSTYSPRGLKPLARIYLKDPCEEEKLLSKVVTKYKHIAKKEGRYFSWNQIPKEILEPYAIKDAVITLELFYLWRERIEQFKQLYDLEKQLIRPNVDMMNRGIKVNRKFVKKMFVKNNEMMEEYIQEMRQILWDNKIKFFVKKAYKIRGKNKKKAFSMIDKRIEAFAAKGNLTLIASHDEGDQRIFKLRESFSPTKAKHLQKAIKRLGIPIKDVTKGGKISTERDTLIKYKDHRFIELKMGHAYLSKQNSTYYGPLFEWYTDKKQRRAHFSFWQSGAKTGRYSAELIQTLPRLDDLLEEEKKNRVREAFIPAKGFFFCCMDYSQIELRLFASYSDSDVLMEAFLNKRDPYVEMARRIFEKEEFEKNPKELRRVAKTITLGVTYGMGTMHMIETLVSETKGAFVITKAKASDILKKFHKTIPVRDYTNELVRNLHRMGSLELKFDSELMSFSRTYHVERDESYKAPNVMCQGCIHGDSFVYEKKFGYVAISTLVNKKVNVWDGEKYSKALCLPSGRKQEVEIVFSNGVFIKCSLDHKFLGMNTDGKKYWWSAKEIMDRDYKQVRIRITNKILFLNSIPKIPMSNEFKNRILKRFVVNRKEIYLKDQLKPRDLGIILGRLVSDGSINIRKDYGGSGQVIWFVAEHEYDIYDYLFVQIGLIDSFSERHQQKKNQKVFELKINSTTLAWQLKHLKIEFPDYLFVNEEALAGFLQGMFDGDGGVYKKHVRLVFGKHVSNEYVMKIQQALLLFGVRSRFYIQKNRLGEKVSSHITVKLRDIENFKRYIGFLSKNKIEKLSKINSVSERASANDGSFGRTLRIESIRLTGKKVEMFDIVNSESGKFMVNGLVTHNSAAYILKLAVLRLYKFLDKHDLHDKVRLLALVHDEMVFEMHNSLKDFKVIKKIKRLIEDHVTFKIPITSAVKISDKSWGKVKEIAFE